MQEPYSKTRTVINKIGRFSPVVFIKKYIILFVFLIILPLSFLFGLWNVKNIDFELPDKSYTDINMLKASADIFKGQNIFLLSIDDIQSSLGKKNEFVKRIIVEKRIPFTLHILVGEYTPSFMGYSSDRCVLFSKEGIHIKELCTECLDQCTEFLGIYPAVYVESTSALENSNKLIYIEEIGDILDILSTFGYSINNISIDEGISVFEDKDSHLFTFDLSDNLNVQLNRMYIVGKKINSESMEFKSLDLRFERPVMKLE